MTLKNLEKTPFPYFGGKSDAAPAVWAALGDVAHYVEPFAGSLAVLLRRPHVCNRPYFSETVNDIDGLLCNAWRSIQFSPEATAAAASWPVCEADIHARHLALVQWRENNQLEHLMGDPTFHDPVMAGWWIWGTCCWIGSGWCDGTGAWTVDAGGRIYKQEKMGAREPGVGRQIPHLGNDGKGVNHTGTREPGVSRQIPYIGSEGRGVTRPSTREPGVGRQIPHLTSNGSGVNHSGTREPGVGRKIPHIGNDGRGVNHPGTWEPGVGRKIPHIGDDGHGVNHPGTWEPGVAYDDPVTEDTVFHPMTMPGLTRWLQFLSARLRHVRILNGDWKRSCTGGATKTLSVRNNKYGMAGIFLDPPYSGDVRCKNMYACEGHDIAIGVQKWCIENGQDPKLRIVLAGYDTEHKVLETNHGWQVVEWYKRGFLKGGMGNTAKGGSTTQQKRERLWLSPHCLRRDEGDDLGVELEAKYSESPHSSDGLVERDLFDLVMDLGE